MAIGTYEQLKTAVSNHMALSGGVDYTDRIPEWIDLAEAKINRRLRVFRQEKWQTISYTGTSSRLLPLPTGFVEPLSVAAKLSTDDDLKYEEVRFVAREQMVSYYTTVQGQPRHYSVRRGDLEFDRYGGSNTYTVRIHFIGQWDIATDATNWLLTNHPDVYLYGALCEGVLFNHNDKRAPMWQAKFDNAITEINLVDERTTDDAELDVSEAAYHTYRRYHGYDINTDT